MKTKILAMLGLFFVVLGFILTLVTTDQRLYTWTFLALGGLLIVLSIVFDFRTVSSALGSRRGKFGLGTTLRIPIFIGIILLVNAISINIYHRFDFTGSSRFTLTSQTKEVLKELDTPVEIVTFFSPEVPAVISSYAENLLNEYKNYSNQLTVRNVDPGVSPDQARQYRVDQHGALYGVAVFRSENGQRQVFGPQIAIEAEYAFTSAILEVTGVRQKKVYFIAGHGESSIYSDYSNASDGLRDNLFRVEELDLLKTGGIPQDAACLVVAGPQLPLADNELLLLEKYLESGGSLFLLLNPESPRPLKDIMSEWWLQIEDGTIIDPSSHVAPHKDTPLVSRDRNRFGIDETYFPGAAAVIPKQTIPENVKLEPLVWSSPYSWLEKDFISGMDPQFNEERDLEGPLAIGAMVSLASADEQDAITGTRIVVIGDSDFASNNHFRNGNNSALFLTAINWLAAGSQIISVDRKVLPNRRLILRPAQARFLHVSSIVLLPLIMLGIGAFFWWRRK